MPEENETKITFVIPCTACRVLNRLEATFKAAPVIEKPEAKPEAEKPKEAEKDVEPQGGATEGDNVRPDIAKGTAAKTNAGAKPKDRKDSAADTETGAK